MKYHRFKTALTFRIYSIDSSSEYNHQKGKKRDEMFHTPLQLQIESNAVRLVPFRKFGISKTSQLVRGKGDNNGVYGGVAVRIVLC